MIPYVLTLLHFMTFPIHTEQNKCHPNPCRNGGTCTGINEGEGFECTCREGFKGKNCEGSLLFFNTRKCSYPGHFESNQDLVQENMLLLLWACAIKIRLKILCCESLM